MVHAHFQDGSDFISILVECCMSLYAYYLLAWSIVDQYMAERMMLIHFVFLIYNGVFHLVILDCQQYHTFFTSNHVTLVVLV